MLFNSKKNVCFKHLFGILVTGGRGDGKTTFTVCKDVTFWELNDLVKGFYVLKKGLDSLEKASSRPISSFFKKN